MTRQIIMKGRKPADKVHPNDAGYDIMEPIILKTLKLK